MRYLSLLIILFSINSFSEDYKSAVRLKEGDVISADVFNDILDKIEMTLKPIELQDLLGTWKVKQYKCLGGIYNENMCDGQTKWTHEGAKNEIFFYREDILTIADNNDGTFSWTSAKFQLLIPNNETNSKYDTGNLTHKCYLSEVRILGCVLSPQNDYNKAFGGTTSAVAYLNIKKTSPTQMVFYEGPGDLTFNHIILDKQSLPPKPPTALIASLSSGTVSLSWTASEGGATSYTIKAKTSATGTYSDVTTGNTSTTYSDSLSTGTKWYRIFAVNSDGTSIGSNVVSVTAP